MKDKLNGLFKPTPEKQRRRRNIAIAIGGMAESIVSLGMVDHRPVLKNILHVVAVGFGLEALRNQSAVEPVEAE